VTTQAEETTTLWKIHGERLTDDTRRLRLSIAGEIVGAASLVGLLHVLAFGG
jgi:hypothetical protein